MALQLLTSDPGRDPRRAVRFIVDTNVVGPVLRWMALGEALPGTGVIDALTWLQNRATSARVAKRDIHVELRWAAMETSRRSGVMDGDKLAMMDAAQSTLLDWIESILPIAGRLSTTPRLSPRKEAFAATNGWSERAAIAAESYCLLLLADLHQRRRAGVLRSPTQRLDALESWAKDIGPVGAMSSHLVLVAIQTALGGDGAPARAMCKFDRYQDERSARAAASNAAWDMHFLRHMRHSEVGLSPYESFFGPTTLLTFDRHLAATAADLVGSVRVDESAGYGTTSSILKTRRHLQNDISRDDLMLERLDSWCRKLQEVQLARWQSPRPAGPDELENLFEDLLASRFA